jgi:hypothetical protein
VGAIGLAAPLAVSASSLALGALFVVTGLALAGDFAGIATRLAARNRRENSDEDGNPQWHAHLNGFQPESAWMFRAAGWAQVALGAYLALDDPF